MLARPLWDHHMFAGLKQWGQVSLVRPAHSARGRHSQTPTHGVEASLSLRNAHSGMGFLWHGLLHCLGQGLPHWCIDMVKQGALSKTGSQTVVISRHAHSPKMRIYHGGIYCYFQVIKGFQKSHGSKLVICWRDVKWLSWKGSAWSQFYLIVFCSWSLVCLSSAICRWSRGSVFMLVVTYF